MIWKRFYANSLFLLAVFSSIQQNSCSNQTPVVGEYKSKVVVRLHDVLTLECPVGLRKGNKIVRDSLMFEWAFNNSNVNHYWQRVSIFKDESILQVSNVRYSDSGIYSCKGVGGFGAKTARFKVSVIEDKFCKSSLVKRYNKKRRKMKKIVWKKTFRPCFIMPVKDFPSQTKNSSTMQFSSQTITRNVDDPVEFDCTSLANPAPSYRWMKDGSSVDWITNVTGMRESKLRINRVKLEYGGPYTCKVRNYMGEITFTYSLIVQKLPPKVPQILKGLSNVTAKIGSKTMLMATITCGCKPTIQWLREVTNPSKNKKYIQIPNARPEERDKFYSTIDPEKDSRINIYTTPKPNGLLVSLIKIEKVSLKDSGKYVLYATKDTEQYTYQTVFITVTDPTQDAMKKSPSKYSQRFMLFILIPLLILIIYPAIVLFCWLRNRNRGRPFSLLLRSNPPRPTPTHQSRLIATKSGNGGPPDSIVTGGSTTSSSGAGGLMHHQQQAAHHNNIGGMMGGISPNHTTGTVSTILSSSNTNRQSNQQPNNSMILYPNSSNNSSIPLIAAANLSANNSSFIHQTPDMNGAPNGGQILMSNGQHHYPLPSQSNHSGSGNSSLIEQQAIQSPQHRIGYITPNSAAIITTSTNNTTPQYPAPQQNQYNQYYTGAPNHQQPSIDFFPHSSSSPSNTYSY